MLFHQLSGWLVSDDPAGEEVRCGGPGLAWSAVVRLVGCTAKFSTTMLDAAYDRGVNIQFSGNSFGGYSCSQNANCMLPQLETFVTLCCVTKLHILEWPFIVPQHKVHLCNGYAV